MSQLKQYIYLTRLNKPIGILLLLWPTLWALWLASGGIPSLALLSIFIAGVILMRSAGCVINDIADRNFDGHVERTRERPLATRKISVTCALILFFILCAGAFLLVLPLNLLTIELAFAGVGLTLIYPFLKRMTHLPQLGLGMAFAWGIPMAFAAVQNEIPFNAWLLFLAGVIWPIMYDTLYAMVDRGDDIKIGIKSTAILFGSQEKQIIGFLQLLLLWLLAFTGILFNLTIFYFLSLGVVAFLFYYQLKQIKHDNREKYFKAFLNNHWVGFIIFLGIFLSFSVKMF